jgi:hypothetical protein
MPEVYKSSVEGPFKDGLNTFKIFIHIALREWMGMVLGCMDIWIVKIIKNCQWILCYFLSHSFGQMPRSLNNCIVVQFRSNSFALSNLVDLQPFARPLWHFPPLCHCHCHSHWHFPHCHWWLHNPVRAIYDAERMGQLMLGKLFFAEADMSHPKGDVHCESGWHIDSLQIVGWHIRLIVD